MTRPSSKDRRFRDTGQQAAHNAALNALPISTEARSASAELAKLIIEKDLKDGRRQRQKRGAKLVEFEQAVGAFLFELLKGASSSEALGWVGVSLAAGAGSGQRVGDRHRKTIVDGLKALAIIEVDPGKQFVTNNGFGGAEVTVRPGRTTRIVGTGDFFRFTNSYGLNPGNFQEHFLEVLPKRTIYLKAHKASAGGKGRTGRNLSIKHSAEVEALEQEVQSINNFLLQFALEGGVFKGYKRRFNEGDLPEFNWNKGGRLYADYQKLPAIERQLFKIDGSPTVELDVSASYLTILHGIHKAKFDTSLDAYRSDVFPRDVVKAYINQSLGSPKLATRWSPEWDGKFMEKAGFKLTGTFKPSKVREDVTTTHPLLKDWGKLETSWADLMFVESEAMLAAIKELMVSHEAPSFVVHDSLIVRERDLELARKAIERGYKAKCGLVPRIKVKELSAVDL